MAMEEEREEGGKVRALIEKATNSTAPEVDPRLLKAIKSVVRYSDPELRLAAQTLMDLMKRDHSQVLIFRIRFFLFNCFIIIQPFCFSFYRYEFRWILLCG